MSNKIVMKQAMFDMVNGLLGLVSQGLQTQLHHQRTRYVVALDTSFAALAVLKACELLGFHLPVLDRLICRFIQDSGAYPSV